MKKLSRAEFEASSVTPLLSELFVWLDLFVTMNTHFECFFVEFTTRVLLVKRNFFVTFCAFTLKGKLFLERLVQDLALI